MAIIAANYTPKRTRLRRGGKLFRRAVLILLPLVVLFSGFLALRQPAAADSSQTTVYIVQAGDSLWKIAQMHAPQRMDIRVYIAQLRQLNQLEQSVIHIGQTLLLPTK